MKITSILPGFYAVCTFDLKDGETADYESAYAALEELGLTRFVERASGEEETLPASTVAGVVHGLDLSAVKYALQENIKRKFKADGIQARVYLHVTPQGEWLPANFKT